MKFACFSDTCAPPIRVPFKPAASIRRAAWSPGGLRNTEPALGKSSGWVATRSAGQESLGYGRIEDMVAGLELIAPAGRLRLPARRP